MKKMGIAMIFLSLILLVSACAGSSTGNAPNNSGATGANNSGTEANAANNGNASNSSNGENAGNDSSADDKTYKIGISQYLEHPSLDATRAGFLDALKDAGLEEGVNLVVDYNTAQADSTNNNSIATKLASGDFDLLVGIATPSAIALAQQEQETPILFAAVTDPLDAKIVESLDKPGYNVTGASDTNPEATKMLMDFIAEHLPEVENIGLIINEGEPNAVVMAEFAEEALADHGIGLISAAVTNTSEVQQAAQSLVGRVDAFFITLDNSVVAAVSAILQIAEQEGIPLFSSDRDTVEAGAVATVGIKYYEHGYQAGEMAVDILLNGADPAETPVTLPDNFSLILNPAAAEKQGVEVTEAMLNAVENPDDNLIQ